MKKVLYTVCVDNYFPELMRYTLPNIQAFADRIGADFHVIKDRKYPEFPPTYEKLQIHELGRANDWNLLVDADAMFHPQSPDPTLIVPPTAVGHNIQIRCTDLYNMDEYFVRDGRFIGVVTNYMCVSNLCHDIWTPLEFSAEEAKKRTRRWFTVDEYCASRNMARFGLKSAGIFGGRENGLYEHLNVHTEEFLTGIDPRGKILERAKKLSEEWK
jgi:hypothetical protein